MTATATAPAAPPRPADPGERGSLRIDPLVVRKVAQHAADQVPGTTTVQRKLAGLGIGEHGSSATVTGEGGAVDIRVELALHYPASVREVAGAVRERVTGAVEHITSYRVRGVDVTVTALRPEIRPRVE